MPWFPDFVSAVELARRQTRANGQADPTAAYLAALERGDARDLETAWPGEVVIQDPRAGTVRGHRKIKQFVRRNGEWLAGLHARTETVASTASGGRAVLELLAYLTQDGQEVAWPVAVVAEAGDDRSVEFRTYCSQAPVTGAHHLRPPVLAPGDDGPGGVVGGYLAALAAGDADAAVRAFGPEGYLREPNAPAYTHRGAAQLRPYFARCFGDGGSVALQSCATTDDGPRCALEYICVRWGDRDLPPEAGLMVCERDIAGRLAAVRLYDDIDTPVRDA
ncbi:nuclear transport factor 2 family protein [Actinomycetospora sp.]|jgi:limonene-1,2-epoxide hydrolase|uniref:nuclear transport factor 2 family protein n=1 Tax=Actinomycetospora sp. TaxID=1872135 RepID=UPI002F3E2364